MGEIKTVDCDCEHIFELKSVSDNTCVGLRASFLSHMHYVYLYCITYVLKQ